MKILVLSLAIASLLVCSFVGRADSSLVAYYSFEEGAGDTTEDKSGNNNTGTLMNDPQWTDGKYGEAISFDGEDDYIDCGGDGSLRISSNVTIEAWVKAVDVDPCQFVAGVCYDDGDAWDNPWVGHQIGVRGGKMATWLNIEATDREYDSGSIAPDTWTHIAMTFDGTWRKSYVNGEEVFADDTISGTIQFEGTPHFAIGVRSITSPGEYFGGSIDEVAMYSRVLTQAEIKQSMEGIFKILTAVEPEGKLTITWGDIKTKY